MTEHETICDLCLDATDVLEWLLEEIETEDFVSDSYLNIEGFKEIMSCYLADNFLKRGVGERRCQFMKVPVLQRVPLSP